LVILFFVTSADSGSLVTDYLTAKTENSPTWQRLFWTVLMALLAIILLLAGAGSPAVGYDYECLTVYIHYAADLLGTD
jgi:Choline-glycine betaine transporter